MKIWIAMMVFAVSVAAAMPAQARNEKYVLPIAAATKVTEASSAHGAKEEMDDDDDGDLKGKLDGSVRFFFGPQKYPEASQKLGESQIKSKAHIHDDDDKSACNAAFRNALLKLQKKARKLGANAVVNIASDSREGGVLVSASEFECHAGRAANVTLKGDLVKLAN